MSRIKRVRRTVPSAEGSTDVGVVMTTTVGGMKQFRCTCGSYAKPAKNARGMDVLKCLSPACGREFRSKKF